MDAFTIIFTQLTATNSLNTETSHSREAASAAVASAVGREVSEEVQGRISGFDC